MLHIEAHVLNGISELHMFPRGYAKHPCTQSVCTLGFAVHPIRPYPLLQIESEGFQLETIFSYANTK